MHWPLAMKLGLDACTAMELSGALSTCRQQQPFSGSPHRVACTGWQARVETRISALGFKWRFWAAPTARFGARPLAPSPGAVKTSRRRCTCGARARGFLRIGVVALWQCRSVVAMCLKRCGNVPALCYCTLQCACTLLLQCACTLLLHFATVYGMASVMPPHE